MQLAMVGLGRMGANLVRRLLRAGHSCVVYDANLSAVEALASEGAVPAQDLGALVALMDAPRAVWVMLPHGDATESTITQLQRHLQPGDLVIDGGNSHSTMTRGARRRWRTFDRLPRHRHQRRRVGAGARLLPDDRRPGGRRCNGWRRSSMRSRPAPARSRAPGIAAGRSATWSVVGCIAAPPVRAIS